MKHIKIFRKGQMTNEAKFEAEDQAQAWLKSCLEKGKFGKHERWVEEKDCTPEEIASALESSERDIGERGREVKAKFYKLPAEYAVEILDVVPDYKELRQAEYRKRIDPFFQEAVMEDLAGEPRPLQKLREEFLNIKKEYPET